MTAQSATARRLRAGSWPLVAVAAVLVSALVSGWSRGSVGVDVVRAELQRQEVPRYALPGDAQLGIGIFMEKGCVSCHALRGEGGTLGPDLGMPPREPLSGAQLAGRLWNHAPGMWRAMRGLDIQPETLTEEEVADLFALLYSAGYLDRTGDPERGKDVLDSYRCLSCHRLKEASPGDAPALVRPDLYSNPVQLAQAMWNHVSSMMESMKQREMPWPLVGVQEMVDLCSYLRQLSGDVGMHVVPGAADPERGAVVFASKGCGSCHPVRGRRPGGAGGAGAPPAAPDLAGASVVARTLTEFAGLMWNHAPAMHAMMLRQGISIPTFSGSEMLDLIGYLFSIRYFDPAGDSGKGAQIYADKGCADCHGAGRGGGRRIPALTGLAGTMSPIKLATAMWNHGPSMWLELQQRGRSWPLFEGEEMHDLIAFLDTPPESVP